MSDAIKPAEPEDDWEADWESHRRAQRRRFANWPLERKLRALEDMDAIARQLLGKEAYRRAREFALRLPRT
ncbi:MAG TPA: hypothetical protein VK824_04440 [Planctomycetota bacterium]|nr:hypothetical protein [Planctomycetota bacterium]